MLACCRGELGPDSDEEQALRSLMDAIDCDSDLSQFSASAAAAVETGRELAERQLAALESASQDLLCSPDIIRCRSIRISSWPHAERSPLRSIRARLTAYDEPS